MTRSGAAARALAGGLVTAGVVIGAPVALSIAVGWPLPSHVLGAAAVVHGFSHPLTDAVIIKILAVVCWSAWAQVTACLAAEIAAAFGRGGALRLPAAGAARSLAAALVTWTLAGVLLLRPAHPTPLRLADAIGVLAPSATAARTTSASPAVPSDEAAPVRNSEVSAPAIYRVSRHDTLWGIAGRTLGDPLRWRELWEANRGRVQSDGRQLQDPHWIYPGWTLVVPTGHGEDLRARMVAPSNAASTAAVSSAATVAPSGPSAPSLPATSDVPSTAAVVTTSEPPSSTAPSSAQPARPAPRPAGNRGASARRSPQPAPRRAQRSSGRARSATSGEKPRMPGLVRLPSGSTLGAGAATALAAVVALTRKRRRRLTQLRPPAPGLALCDDVGAVIRTVVATAVETPTVGDHVASPIEPGLVLGERDGDAVSVEPTRFGILQLAGTGAEAAARALLVTALADAGVVVLSQGLARRLGIDAGLGAVEVVDTISAGLTRAEHELVARARLLDAEGLDDIDAHRLAHPDDRVPRWLVFVEAPDQAQTARLRAVATLTTRLAMAVIVVGESGLDAPGLVIASGGDVEAGAPASLGAALVGASLLQLSAAETVELLGVLAAGRSEVPPELASSHEEDFLAPTDRGDTLIDVALFGPGSIRVNGTDVRTGLRTKARELMAFFLLHPQGATAEQAVDVLWPEAPPGRGVEWFWAALGNLRTRLRQATDVPELKIIDRSGEIYRADASVLACDVWRFESAMAIGRDAASDDEVVDALAQAAAAYSGDLLAGSYSGWVEAPRQDLRRRALDVLARLAELRERSGDIEGALAALDQALVVDPYPEEVYRRLMRLQGATGRLDAVRRTYARLEVRLAELSVEPEMATVALLEELLGGAAEGSPRGARRRAIADVGVAS